MTTELLQVSDIKYKFVNVSEVMEADLKKVVESQIANKGQSVLKKIYAKNIDAKVIIDYSIIKNKAGLYESDFIFLYDGEKFTVSSHKGFKIARDMVSHAFDKRKRNVLGFWGSFGK